MSDKVNIYFITSASNVKKQELYVKLGVTANLRFELLRANYFVRDTDQMVLLHSIAIERWCAHFVLQCIKQKISCPHAKPLSTGWIKLRKNFDVVLQKLMKRLSSTHKFDPLLCKIAEVSAIDPQELIISHGRKTLMSWEFCSMYGIDVCKNNVAIKLWNAAIDKHVTIDADLLAFLNLSSTYQLMDVMDTLNMPYKKTLCLNGVMCGEVPQLVLTFDQYATLAAKFVNPTENLSRWPQLIYILCQKYFEYIEMFSEIFSTRHDNNDFYDHHNHEEHNPAFLDVPIEFVTKAVTDVLYKDNPTAKEIPANIRIFNNFLPPLLPKSQSTQADETLHPSLPPTPPPTSQDGIDNEMKILPDLYSSDFDDVFAELDKIFQNDHELESMFQNLIK